MQWYVNARTAVNTGGGKPKLGWLKTAKLTPVSQTTSVTTTLTDFEATTTVTTATALTTTTVIVDVPAYAQVAGPYDGCGILHYDDWTPNQSLNDESNVQAGTDFCIQQCNSEASIKN
jgi:hypothetical protein